MLIAVSISFFFLSKESLRLDESQSLWQTSHSFRTILHIIALDVHVPLYHSLLHYWEILFGNGVASSRVLSLIFFVLAIPSLYLLALRAYEDKAVALFATSIFALSPFMNWYGSEIRMYSLFVLLAIVSHYFFLGIYKYGDHYSHSMYTIIALLGIFTHYFFFFVLLVQGIFFIVFRKVFFPNTFNRLMITVLILAIAFSPWAYYVWSLGSASTSRPLLPNPDSINIFNALAEFFIGFQNTDLNSIIISSWPLSVLVFFLALRKHNHISKETWYFIFSAFIPMILVYIISSAWRPLYTSRYLIFTAPAFYMIISSIISSYHKPIATLFKSIIILGIVFTLSMQLLSADIPVKENYSEATAYLNTHVSGDDIIIVSAPFTIYPIEYYYKGKADLKTIPEWDRSSTGGIPPFNEETFPADIRRLANGYRKMWVILSYDQGYESKINQYMETHYQLLEERKFSKDLIIYEYQLRYD